TRVERGIVWLGRLPQKAVVPLIVVAVGVLVAGILLEDRFEIESDPVKWVNQDTQTVRDIQTLQDETGFESTLGVLIEANNVNAQPLADLLFDFLRDAEAREQVAETSSMVSTLWKITETTGASAVPPRAEDLDALIEVMPDDIRRVLVNDDHTAAQINLRLGAASLEEDAVLVAELESDLEQRIADLDLPADSILLVELDGDQQPVRAVPAGLAIVGVGLLENLKANRAVLTYLALVAVGLWLLLRHRSL
ncbi:MAG: hypothetical protein GWN79_19120, partial [Actinobacteria bacterium]|nr:hypothetical protein [Actinomycetota bacterium]NIS34299.1 hypothetical protein [Actinomycetota bacterium]NIU21050.1 hypothetical protein [Actinomycetota bacterium]NIU69080.1 hypothetical protein [Actinomycetota bacterium]NIV57567.1 hypothetical protein [Actinomycetota bacterium]